MAFKTKASANVGFIFRLAATSADLFQTLPASSF